MDGSYYDPPTNRIHLDELDFSSPDVLMHEFGHNLNLQHGGNTGVNCKPNYISVMNYDLQFGIQQVAGSGQGQDFDLDGVLVDSAASRVRVADEERRPEAPATRTGQHGIEERVLATADSIRHVHGSDDEREGGVDGGQEPAAGLTGPGGETEAAR